MTRSHMFGAIIIFESHVTRHTISGIWVADVSDHLPVFLMQYNADIVDPNVDEFSKPSRTRVM